VTGTTMVFGPTLSVTFPLAGKATVPLARVTVNVLGDVLGEIMALSPGVELPIE
jgi:hypothetical protein